MEIVSSVLLFLAALKALLWLGVRSRWAVVLSLLLLSAVSPTVAQLMANIVKAW